MIGSEVIIEGLRLDVMEGMDFSFNYSVADIRQPDKRQTEFSKTVKCPATANNNRLFGHVFSVTIANPFDPSQPNVGVNFNPNKKADAQVLHNSIPVMSGSVQLRKVTVTDGLMSYEVVFIGKLLEIFGAWGDRKMNEVTDGGARVIDLSDLDHALTDVVQAASWTAPVGQGYVYPLIDYGRNFIVDSQGRRTYKIIDLRPAIYVRELWDRCFAFAGATYEGTFFDGTLFDRLIMPWTKGFELSAEDIEERTINAIRITNRELFPAPTPALGYLYDMEQTTFDPSSQYNTSTSEITIANNSTYKISGQIQTSATKITSGAITGQTDFTVKMFVNGSLTFSTQVQIPLPASADPNGTTVFGTAAFTFPDIVLAIADVVVIRYDVPLGNPFLNNNIQLLSGSDLEVVPSNEELAFGDNVVMNYGMPDISIKDFITSIIKMFNLYVTPHPAIEDRYIFETRDVYYSQGVIRDWTKKMARDKPIDITPMGLLAGREYLYAYKEDGDYYNERHQKNYGRTYGSRLLDVDNDFVPERRDTEVEFSPTPLSNDVASSRIIPRIYDADISEGRNPTSTNPRILYYGGLLASVPTWRHGLTGSYLSTYPYAGHWDNPINPTLDLNWGISQEYYYQPNGATGPVQISNNNLFKAYHERQFLELSNKDSKLITAMFHLTALDIEALDFRDTILIDQTYYRLNKVMDYNPFKHGLTKVELFKAADITVSNPVAKSLGDVGMIGNEKAGKTPNDIKTNGNQYEPFQGKVIGSNNTVSKEAVGFFVQGDNNVVSASRNVTVIGSGNFIAAGADNVKLINTDNVAVNQSNVTYINGNNVTEGTAYLNSFDTTSATTATTTEEVLHSYTLPANTIAGNRGMRVRATWTSAANANTKTFRIKLNGVTIYDSSAAVPTDTAPNNGRIHTDFIIQRNGNTTGKVQGVATISTTGTSPVAVGVGQLTGLNWRNDQTVEFIGQNGTSSANDIVLQAVIIDAIR
jgi:hypothetical protein